MRNKPIWNIFFTLTLAIASAGALAADGDGQWRGGNREDMREQRQILRQERDRSGADQRVARELREPRLLPPGQQYAPQETPPEGGRRNGRMSPEERRALRRQIDQASHDIYPPGR